LSIPALISSSKRLICPTCSLFNYFFYLCLRKDKSNLNRLNSEIDFEWLIANPQLIYLTAWTDCQEKNGVEDFRKIWRIINLATGKIYSTTYAEK